MAVRASKVGCPGKTALSCATSNFGRSLLLCLNSDSGVLGFYGKPLIQDCSHILLEDIGQSGRLVLAS